MALTEIEMIRHWDLDFESLYVFKSESGNTYCTYINFDEDFAHCNCPSFTYAKQDAKTCKHIKMLAEQFPPKNKMVYDMSLLRERFLSSSVLGINTLIGGYLPKVPYGLYGFAAAGKSILALQEGYAIAKQMSEKEGKPKGILYYDTEGDGDILQMLWEHKLEERFGKQKFVYMDTEIPKPAIPDTKKSVDTRLINKVCKDWGLLTKIRKEIPKGKDSEFKGKVRFEWHGDVVSKVEEKIITENIGVVIIDSITDPLDGFPGGTMNFPARADAIKYWMSQVHLFAKRYGLVVITIHHASKSPTQGTMTRAQMVGGTTLFYRFKVVICLETVGDERKARLSRFFNKKEFDEEVRLVLGDNGFVDSKTVPRYSKMPSTVFKGPT
jgi:hypothetical protein